MGHYLRSLSLLATLCLLVGACGARSDEEATEATPSTLATPATQATPAPESSPLPDTSLWPDTTAAETEQWNQATLTWYISYAEPGSEECVSFNGCQYPGQFAGLVGVQSEEWVMANNIIAVHEKDFEQYKLKTFSLRQGDLEIEAIVYDMCADSDCSGCCTANIEETGFLIDLEWSTMQRFGSDHGVIEWRCLDC